MKIGILDYDEIFVKRLSEMLRKNGAEVFSFSGVRKAQIAAREMNLDMLLINAEKNCKSFNNKNIPEHCKVIALTERKSEAENLKFPFEAICKYQSAEAWNSFLENVCTGRFTSLKGGLMGNLKDAARICLFTSASGGQGTTAAALAFAAYLSVKNYKVLYFNAQTVCADCGEAFKEVFESYGFSYRQTSDFCADILDINGEKIITAVEECICESGYEVVIIDMNMDSFGNVVVPILNSEKTVWVSNGNKSSNAKLSAVIRSLPKLCGLSGKEVSERCIILYNKFQGDGEPLSVNEIPVGRAGGIAFIENSKSNETLVRDILKSGAEAFDRISEALYV